MASREINWTKRATQSFNNSIKYVNQEFGDNVTMIFVNQTYADVERLAKFPKLGKIEQRKNNIRAFVISKHITVFYRFTKDRLIVLNLFNNLKYPKKKRWA